jgi:hypothetical protein
LTHICQEETMQPSHHEAAHLAALGREWIAAWNSHDLERVLALHCLKPQRWRSVQRAFACGH